MDSFTHPVMNPLRRLYQSATAKLLILIAALGTLFYLFFFSTFGNRLWIPVIETALSATLESEISVDHFELHRNRFRLAFHDPFSNSLSLQGGFSLLTLRMYAHYRVTAPQSGGINPLNTPFKTEGALSGGISSFSVEGNSNLFKGQTVYSLEFHRFSLANVHVEFDDIDYKTLFNALDIPCNTQTLLFGRLNLTGLDRRDIEGSLHLYSRTKHFAPTPIREDDNASFEWRHLFEDSDGKIRPFRLNLTVDASVENIGIFEQFAGTHIQGPAEAIALLQGDEKLLHLDVRSTLASSDTELQVDIPDLEPALVTFSVHHADLSKGFELFSLSPPLVGRADASGELTTNGARLHIGLSHARSVPAILRRDYNITQPDIAFDADIDTVFTDHGGHYRASFRSDLGRLDFNRSVSHDQMLQDLLKSIP